MRTIRNALAAGMIALVIGFAGGELLGPTATAAASSGCPMEACFTGAGDDRFCAASGAPLWCDVDNVFGCLTTECETPCDPGDPECEPD
jgi:hypothetical protein